MGPKIGASHARRPSIEQQKGEGDTDEGDKKIPEEQIKARKWSSSQSEASDVGSEDKQGSQPGTPSQKPSQFAGKSMGSMVMNNIGNRMTPDSKPRQMPANAFHTPVIGKKKTDLYKVSIMSNMSKYSGNPI